MGSSPLVVAEPTLAILCDGAAIPTCATARSGRRDRVRDLGCRGARRAGPECASDCSGDPSPEGLGIIGPSGAVCLMMATRPVDFRKGMDGLAALMCEAMGADPFSGTLYVYRSKRADRAKLLFWDGSGVVLPTKRLEAGQFSLRR